MVRKVKFWKYEGNGNDFIIIIVENDREIGEKLVTNDNFDEKTMENMKIEEKYTISRIQRLCHRNYGIGGDGIIFLFINDAKYPKYRMRIYNSDGSLAIMCGNGLRCLVKFIDDVVEHRDDQSYEIITDAGIATALITEQGLVTINLDPPLLFFRSNQSIDNFRPISFTLPHGNYDVLDISLGNPHAARYFSIDGRALSTHDYFPDGVNAEFVEVISPHHVSVRVWERGAGPTLACGTGACAVVIACVLMGYVRKNTLCTVTLPGGDLHICWKDDNSIQLTGPATFVYEGTIDISSWYS